MSFSETFKQLEILNTEFYDNVKLFNDSVNKEQEEYYRKKFPKRKKIDWSLLDEDYYFHNIWSSWRKKADDLREEYDKNKKIIENKLNDLAVSEEIPKTNFLGLCSWVSSSSYHTQGWGANSYAKAEAEAKADAARVCGFHAEVMQIGVSRYINGYHYEDYGVFVNTSDIGWEMILRRPTVSTKEWIQNCLKRGVNPRVYNPFLPYNIEEKLGLDYYGNEKK